MTYLKKYLETPVSYTIVFANILIFVYLEIIGSTVDSEFMVMHGALCPYYILNLGQWYRLFTCMFLHFGIEHIFFNMLLLFFLGPIFEKAVGIVRFTAIYFLSGVAGSYLSFFMMELKEQDYKIAAGASGAIFGVAGGMLIVVLVHRGQYEGITARRMAMMVVVTLLVGFGTAGTDNAGHVGGVIMGIFLTFITYGIPVLIEFRHEKQYTLDKSIEDEGE